MYGDKEAGDPVEYDHLRLILTDDVVEIEVFNRGVTLFMTDDEKVRVTKRVGASPPQYVDWDKEE